ncbi:Spy/CpxP family protein refolding chaperone [Mesorhizobium captivum]|uniref:Spy/CpxP family protein refolding chaperone n=1 Tax=Mesorhizobium captivum TaxID=3072319 RepID=UPI002A2438B1|nr:Spy/CpxP family protein refolding chaperone [Mesorhizobium sp. VK3C]MDX8450690.1 Spy/CpxP family protein refolding chaperone [Mesorhizobium sp. VK3C]
MKSLFSILAIGTLLVFSAPVLANEAHHATGGGNGSPPAAATEKAEDAGAGSAMPMTMGGSMPNNMMSNGMMKMMMDMMSGDDSPMGQMMSPEHVEGRIAFLSTELKLTKAQRPLWDAVAEALRANAGSAKEMMAKMPAGMMSGDSATGTPVKRIELQERMLSTRLEGLRRLKAALEPFYGSLDDAQKAVADKLLMPAPMGMM